MFIVLVPIYSGIVVLHRKFEQFEGTNSTQAPGFRTETEHKLSSKTKTTKISPDINPLDAQTQDWANAKMAHSKSASHHLCATTTKAATFNAWNTG
jgi:hypothetical protein